MKNIKLLKKLSIPTLFAAILIIAPGQAQAEYKVSTSDKNIEVVDSTTHEFKKDSIVAGILKNKTTGKFTLVLFSKNSKGETVDKFHRRGCEIFSTSKATSGLAIEIHCVENGYNSNRVTNVYELKLVEKGNGLSFGDQKLLANRSRAAPMLAIDNY